MKTLEQVYRQMKLKEVSDLYYGSDKARDTYAKDTPGQTPGVEHDPVMHQHKPDLAMDGVPMPGGELKKPQFQKGIKDGGPVTKGNKLQEKKVKCEHCNGTGKHDGEDCTECKGTGMLEEYYDAHHGEDPSDATPKAELEKERSERLKKMMKNKKPKPHQSYGKGGKNDPRGMGSVLAMGEGKGMKNCGCGKDPCETYGKGGKEEMKEAGRWDQSTSGRAYRRLSPEEKARQAKKNELKRQAKAMKGNMEIQSNRKGKVSKGQLKSVYKGKSMREQLLDDLEMAYLGEMSPGEAARRDAMRDAKSAYGKPKVDPADKDSSYKEKKRGRGERDLPHIVTQMRSVVDNDKHPGVKFKDGTTKKVSQKQASAYLKKHDSAKPGDKLNMYKAHDSHKSFMKHVGEAVDEKDKKGLKKLVKGLKGSSAAHMDQMKDLEKMIKDHYIPEGSKPNNPKLWAAKKAQAKAKFDVYPSAYANGWAAKQYKKAGGTWRSESVEHDINELSTRTLTNYIQKAANPVKKKSAINLASKGAYKLGKSDDHDLEAGEKEDRKAFTRGKGIMRAAQKIQRKTYGNMTKPTPYGGSEMSKSLTRKTKNEEKMSGQEYRTQMDKVKSKDPAVRKAVTAVLDKKGKVGMKHPDVDAAKKYMKSEETVNEISADLINRTAAKRRANVSKAYSEYDDYRNPNYKKAMKKLDRNKSLTFRAGAKKADQFAKALSKSIANQKRDK